MRDWLVTFGMKKKPRDPNALRYADIYERSMAAIIDLVLIYLLFDRLVFQPISRALYANVNAEKINQLPSGAPPAKTLQVMIDSGMLQWWLISTVVQLLIIAAIIVAVQITRGTTPGKWLLGLKIVRRGTLAPLEPWRYVWRILACFVAAAPLMIGIFWAIFNKERRGWHDMMAGTVVIHTRPEWWYWHQVKRGARWFYGRLRPSASVEQPVAEPSTTQRHDDGNKPV